MDFYEFIKPELLILVPVMYLIGAAIKKSEIADRFIPAILGGVAVLLSALWIGATSPLASGADIAMAIFAAITQGVLVAGASVYVNQIVKQTGKDE